MTAADRRKLAAILGMLGSEHAGERASAALQAEAFRKRHAMTWEEMLALPPVEVVVEPEPVWTPSEPPRPAWTPPPAAPPPPPPVTEWEFIDVRQPSKSISYNVGVAVCWFLLFGAALAPIQFLR
jgi:hypothetical protein